MIVRMQFGSHLYGTSTPQSDTDYRGVFLPAVGDVLYCRAPRTQNSSTKQGAARNTPQDVDSEAYALHYFLELAYAGETVALDMLHARKHQTIVWTPPWQVLHQNRSRFYTKNLKALVSYARKQAAKYGVKGTRIAAVKEALAFLKAQPEGKRLEDVWDALPINEHCYKQSNEQHQIWNVCGKQLIGRAYVSHYIDLLEDFLERYGHRARLAEENQGIDWKAVMHAYRAAYQVRSILKWGDFQYPLPETERLRMIRLGQLDWQTDVSPGLDALLAEVETLSQRSTLPERPDREWGDNFLLAVMKRHVQQTLKHNQGGPMEPNIMRQEYRVLSEDEKAHIWTVKDLGLKFYAYLDNLGQSRELSLAKTKIEEAVMWATKHITK